MSNRKITVYLAGSIGKDRWRLEVIKECQDVPAEFLSPIDDISYSYQALCKLHPQKRTFHVADKMKIDKSSVVFAYFKESSIDKESMGVTGTLYSGTSWECGYAYALGKHIIVINDMKPALECRYELIKRFADVYYKTLNEGIDHLRELAFEMNFVPVEK